MPYGPSSIVMYAHPCFTAHMASWCRHIACLTVCKVLCRGVQTCLMDHKASWWMRAACPTISKAFYRDIQLWLTDHKALLIRTCLTAHNYDVVYIYAWFIGQKTWHCECLNALRPVRRWIFHTLGPQRYLRKFTELTDETFVFFWHHVQIII